MYPSQQLYKAVNLPPNVRIMNLSPRDPEGHTSPVTAEHRSESGACAPAPASFSPCRVLSLLYFIHFSQLSSPAQHSPLPPTGRTTNCQNFPPSHPLWQSTLSMRGAKEGGQGRVLQWLPSKAHSRAGTRRGRRGWG